MQNLNENITSNNWKINEKVLNLQLMLNIDKIGMFYQWYMNLAPIVKIGNSLSKYCWKYNNHVVSFFLFGGNVVKFNTEFYSEK